MKIFYRFLLPVLLLFSLEAKSQTYTYHPFPDSSFVWEGLTRCFGLGMSSTYFWSCSITGDTLINGVTHHIIGSAFVREDSNKRVYAIYPAVDTSMEEHLLYDFSFALGDTFFSPFTYLTVYKVDTLVYSGVPRRTIYLRDSSGRSDRWIEGIGSYLNPFGWRPWYGGGNCLVSLLCYALKDSIIIYQNEADCFGVNSVVDVTGYMEVFVFPNPTTSSFTLQLSSSPLTETYLLLYDALGREVKRELITAQVSTLNRNQLPVGIYYWQLQSGGSPIGRGKVIFD